MPVEIQIKDYLEGQQKYFRFNGNVLVAEKGKIIFQRSYGYADFNTGRMLNDSSVFELASVSKQFTATGILMLRDQGKLKLSDSLRKFFPELPYQNITLYHMLTHTSGLPDYEAHMNRKWDKTRIAFNSDMISFLAKEKPPVEFSPGSKWEYSNTAFAMLASIIEKVSGQSFSEFLDQNIFKPLGMNSSRIYNTRRSRKDTIDNYAYGFMYNDVLKRYMLPDSIPVMDFVRYLDGLQGDGVVNSTTGDLVKWDRALKNHKLLNIETQREMLAEHELVDTANKFYYGYGVFIRGNVIEHSGGWPGYLTNLARNVEKDQTFIILSNNSSDASAISRALQEIMAGRSVVMPYEHKAIKPDSGILRKFEGNYGDFSIQPSASGLYKVLRSGRKVEFKAESATRFFRADTDEQLEFETDKGGNLTRAWRVFYGVRTEMKKRN
ncbi:MAG TPA: serine hydrolase domain-containing protein [Chitinophagaceae bacterium]|nr:serine hydrolase domain-containing protein [Chitinophagaceae bacterium]